MHYRRWHNDSGGTIVNAVDALKKSGANEVYVFITHAVLSGDAVKKLKTQELKIDNYGYNWQFSKN